MDKLTHIAVEWGRRFRVVARQETQAVAAGLLGALASAIVMLALRLTVGAPTLPELVGERILPLLPVDLFIKLLITFQPHPKTGPLGLALLGQIVLGAALGPLLHRLGRVPATVTGRWPARRAWLAAGGLALAMEVLALALFWPVLAENLAGDPIGRARIITLLCLLTTFATYAGITLVADHLLRIPWPAAAATKSDHAAEMSRRTLIARASAAALGVVIELVAINALIGRYLARSNLAYEGMATPLADNADAITPTPDFYVVSKNVLDPVVDVSQWELEITGLVHAPREWNLAALQRLPVTERAITLECISNGIGNHLISTATWRGVTLRNLLAAAGGATPSGKFVIFRSVDGYATSLPLADLLAADALLAWEMNGAPLPQRHGAPLRTVVPGRYGEQSAKWLTQIEISDQPFKGFYQSQGWSDAPVHTISRIDQPAPGPLKLGATMISGIAYAGTRGIQRVEVSADGGATWHDAALTPPLSPDTWVLWQWPWTPPAPGRYLLLARATDGTGAVQTMRAQGTVPAGATGWHMVKVQVYA